MHSFFPCYSGPLICNYLGDYFSFKRICLGAGALVQLEIHEINPGHHQEWPKPQKKKR